MLVLSYGACVIEGDLTNTGSTVPNGNDTTWADSQVLFGDTVHEVKITLESSIFDYYYAISQ